MLRKVSFKTFPVNDQQNRYVVRYESDDATVFSDQNLDKVKRQMLREFVSNEALFQCGPVNFSKMKMFFENSKSVIELEGSE
jgi:hypothetical protein